jgi:transmembrane sensor
MAKADKSVAEFAPRAHSLVPRFVVGRRWLALVASVVILLAGLAAGWSQYGRATYSTGVGEQRSIAMRDGSTVELNSQSRVRIRLDDKQRTIELLRGQALFRVAKDSARPFVVRADNTAVRAVGTVFDVYRKNVGTIVTVVEGRVSVIPEKMVVPATRIEDRPDQSRTREANPVQQIIPRESVDRRPGELLLSAGEQLVVSRATSADPKRVNVSAATAWTRRELVFEFAPLTEVAAEFNRYNERKLVVESEKLRAFKISAVFRSTDSGSLVRYLEKMSGVRIEESEDTVRIRTDSKN